MFSSSDLSARRYVMLFSIGAICASLCLYHLDFEAFWLDEVVSASIANAPRDKFWSMAFGHEATMTFYYLVLRVWLELLPATDFNIRLVSVVAALISLPLLYLLSRRLFDERVAFATTLLLALSPEFVYYAREARSYTLTVALTLGSWLLFTECIARPALVKRVAYIGVTTLAIYAHNLAALIVPAQLLTVLVAPFAPAKRFGKLWFILDTAIVVFLSLPLAIQERLRYSNQVGWIAIEIGKPGLAALIKLFGLFAAGPLVPPWTRPAIAALCVLAVLFAIGFASFAVQLYGMWGESRNVVFKYWLVVAGVAVPIAMLFGISRVYPLFMARYLLIALPFFLLADAVGWCRLKSRSLPALGLSLTLLVFLFCDWNYYAHPKKPDWKGAVAYIAENAASEDKLACLPSYSRFEFDYNFRRFGNGATPPIEIYPVFDSDYRVQGDIADALKPDYRRLWILDADIFPDRNRASLEAMLGPLEKRYSKVTTMTFRGISIFLFERHAGL